MSAPSYLLALTVVVVAHVALARWTRSLRQALGISDGAIVSSDDSMVYALTLRSERLGLVGRCDQLLRLGAAYVLVEQKSSSQRLYPSHILQVGALCLLVEDVYGVRPPYGVVVLAGGVRERVAFTRELEHAVRLAMAEMRRVLATGEPPGPRWVAATCRACGYRSVCWDDEAINPRGDHAAGLGARPIGGERRGAVVASG